MELNQSEDRLEINYKPTYELPTINWFGLLGALAVILSLLMNNLALFFMGLFFLVGYWIVRSGFSVRQTVLSKDGSCEVTTKRVYGNGIFKQTFTKSDITKITYIKGYSDKVRYYNSSSGIYIQLKTGEKLEILSRPAFKPLTFMSNKPLDQEADVISHFLNISVETVDISTLKSGLQNFDKALEVGQHDPSMVILQPKATENSQQESKIEEKT